MQHRILWGTVIRTVIGALAVASAISGCDSQSKAPADTTPVADTVEPSDVVAPDATNPPDGTNSVDTSDTTTPDTVVPTGPIDPGRVVWRRLNRTEYRNTLRDLFGSDLDPGVDLPADDLGYGFDNIASVLTLSPLHLELYERAARLLTEEATRPPITESVPFIIEAETAEFNAEYGSPQADTFFMWSAGELTGYVDLPADGRYRFEVRAWETPAGDEGAKLAVWVSGAIVGVVELVPTAQTYTIEVTLEAGRHALAVEFLNDFWDPSFDPPADRNAIIDRFGLVGPLDLEDFDASAWSRIVQCRPTALERTCAASTVTKLAERAWRRPVDAADRDRLMELFDAATLEGTPPAEALALTLQAVLLTPRFLFKVEAEKPNQTRLDGYEIATRLSYFLWSTMPDTALFDAARTGKLDTTAGIADEVRRMLGDPKAQALVDNFAGQWLYIRDIDNVFPDPWLFPEFDELLRDSMTEEMRRFFRSFIDEDRSMLEMLTATETWMNRRLAEHYQVDDQPNAPTDDTTWVRMSTGDKRRGLLSQAGLLTALSTPFRTSVVRRGKWTLGQLLCAEPSPPPPGVEGLLDANPNGGANQAKTLRERMEAHKTEERCKTCHVAMDGIGFALEHFDGIGAWRDTENGYPIDATGVLRGNNYDGAVELANVIANDARLPACFVDKVMIYAVGRGLRGEDQPLLDRLVTDFAARGHRFTALVELIATSEAFTHRAHSTEEAGQ